jgi:hypothetical protein
MPPLPLVAAIVLLMLLPFATGCSGNAPPTRIELQGTPGAPVTGYYIHNDRRVELNAKLPTTLPSTGISQFAVRKTNIADNLVVKVEGPDGSMQSGLPPGQGPGVRVQVAGGMNVSFVSAEESLSPTGNALRVISPYWHEGTWVFDDPQTGLQREPFVSGIPEMIDYLARDIPNARGGFRLTFSMQSFPGYQQRLTWLRAESGGNWYKLASPSMEGWLCPAMFRYFDKAPKELFVRAESKAG